MGRKSRKSCMIKPFCYFCMREFDDEKVLIMHQKAKHFKCSECNRKLETANGLMVHMQQVHKIVIRRVPHSLEGRDNINSSIQGMNGVPVEVIEEHRIQHFQKLSNLKKQKEQRINWAQVHPGGFKNMGHPAAAAMTVPPTQTNGLPPTNMTSNNTGFTDKPGFSDPVYPAKTGFTDAGFTSSGFSDGPGVTGGDEPGKANKLLILDPNGMPVLKPVSQPPMQFQPVQPQLVVPQQHQPPLLSQSNMTTYPPPVFNPPQSFTQPPPSSHSFSSNHMGFSGPKPPAPSTKRPRSPQPPSKPLDRPESRPSQPKPEDDFVTTVYKATGVQPLYVPPPTLSNTKLSYSSDSVSIEELRAKVKFNWHETPS